MNHGTFRGNSAHVGGGLAVEGAVGPPALRLERLAFVANVAVDGASVHWSRLASPLRELACYECTHASQNASDISTEAVSLGFVHAPAPHTRSTEKVPPFAVGLVDAYGQLARSAPTHLCQISPALREEGEGGGGVGAPFVYGEDQQIQTSGGVARFVDLRMEGRIGTVYAMDAVCLSRIDGEWGGEGGGALSLSFAMKIARCLPGQQPAQSQRQCLECDYGTYSFDGLECKPCPRGAVCPGRAILHAEEGWWRPHNLSEALYACPKPAACLGGADAGNAACEAGYVGPVCGLCDAHFHKWGASCRRCSRLATYVLPPLIILSLGLTVTVFLNAAWDPNQSESVVRMNMLIAYMQVLGRLNYFSVRWPARLSEVLGWFDFVNVAAKISAPRCIEETDFYATYAMTMAVPILITASYAGLYVAKAVLCRVRCLGPREVAVAMDASKVYCFRSVVWLYTLVYLGVASLALQLFGTQIIEGKHYLVSDYSIVVKEEGEGVTPTHQAMVAIGCVFGVLYPIGIPLLLYRVLWHSHRRGGGGNVHDAVAFLVSGYREACYYWEVLEMVRTLAISIIPILFPRNVILQNTVAQTIVFWATVMNGWYRPYRTRVNNLLAALCHLSLWALFALGGLLEGNLGRGAEDAIAALAIGQVAAVVALLVLANVLALSFTAKVAGLPSSNVICPHLGT